MKKFNFDIVEFNFKGIYPSFREAIKRHEPSIAFRLMDGRGRFLFLLFVKTDLAGCIEWNKLELFILLARTQKMLRFKLYGKHTNGNFIIYLSRADEDAIRRELDISQYAEGAPFVLLNFLSILDGKIPASISLEDKVALIQSEKTEIAAHCGDYIDDASKVYLLAIKQLPNTQRPREETLRKLYMLGAKPADITALICKLKAMNCTVSWTATKPESDKFAEIFARITKTSVMD